MNKLVNMITGVALFFVLGIALVSCSGGGSGTVGSSGGLIGVPVAIVDAPSKRTYQAVFVTIEEMSIKPKHGSWIPLSSELNLPKTIELLELVNGVRSELGIVNLKEGHYNQMRLKLAEEEFANYVIDSAGNKINLSVTSGDNSGFKLVNGFDIEISESTDIIVLDFDVQDSVHPAGNSDKWILKPTIKVVEVNNSVRGTVEPAENKPVAWVTAQSYNPGADEVKDEVEIRAGVFSLGDGSYFVYLPINITDSPYNIVATKEGFATECQALDSTASDEYEVNFALLTTDTGTLSGSIINLPVPEAENDYSVSLRIRQLVDCGGVPETMIDVESRNYVNENGDPIPYGPFTLPAGEYEIVAWADGASKIVLEPLGVDENGDIIVDDNGDLIVDENGDKINIDFKSLAP